MRKGKKRITTDAHEPNAGTDFHILWTVRKCLELLNFKPDGLKSVALEGLVPKDNLQVDPYGDILLGVDLTEYYSGSSFKKASNVVISQLKYSTKHSDITWTSSKMCQGKRGTDGSIIHKLAKTFKGFLDTYGSIEVLKKTKIKLISNRPIDKILPLIIIKAQNLIKTNSANATFVTLNKNLLSKEKTEVKKLFLASKLGSKPFVQFLSLLDFSDCGTDQRFVQKQNAIKAIIDLGAFDAKNQLAILESLIRSKTHPESKDKNVLSKEDILLEFDFHDIDSLFPVPPRFEILHKTVKREQVQIIKELIIKPENKGPFCIHGVAGIGKSTIIQQIRNILPAQSESVILDCYGGGSYLDPDDKRHLHEKAFLFICNKMALKIGTPFLLKRGATSEYYISEFSRRIKIAAEVLKKRDKSAIFVLIVDAADNSITAALEKSENSFVEDIVKVAYPDNVRLIVTTRTHRKDSLHLPEEHNEYELNPFSIEETGSYLSNFFKNIALKETKEFNDLSEGIPRVMAYTMEAPGSTLPEKLKPLKPKGKNLEDIFKIIFKNAEKKSGDKKLFKAVISHLIVLPRPIPIHHLQLITNTDKSFIKDVAIDLWKGILFDNGFFRFKDEDFETFLKDNFKLESINYNNIASTFLKYAESEDYSSTYLGLFLYKADRFVELENIVLNRLFLKHPTDPVKNKETFIVRARLAMKNASGLSNKLNYLKLQVVCSEAAKANSVLEDLMLERPELASAFGNVHSNNKLYFKQGNPNWAGRVHLRSAAILSRDLQTIEQAKIHLNNAESWIKFRGRLSAEKRRNFDIDDNDLAYGAEAMLRISGPTGAIKWLSRWRPRVNIFHSIWPLIINLLSTSSKKQIDLWFKGSILRFDICLHINQIFFENGFEAPFTINSSLEIIKRLKGRKVKILLPIWQGLISFAEQLTYNNKSKNRILSVLKLFELQIPESSPSFYKANHYDDNTIERLDLFFKVFALKSALLSKTIKIDDIIPVRYKKDKKADNYNIKEARENERKKFEAFYKHMIPTYVLLAETYLKSKTRESILKSAAELLDKINKDFELGYRYEYQSRLFPNFIAGKLLQISFLIRNPKEIINLIYDKLKSGKSDVISLLLGMAERLSISHMHSHSVLSLLGEVDKKIESGSFSGKSQIEYYTSASLFASRVSFASGKYYFDKLINASNDIDSEAFEQIKIMAKLSFPLREMVNERLAFDYSRYVEYCSVKLDGYEDFPWESAIAGISNMDGMSVMAIASRWDHRNVRSLSNHLPEILSVAMLTKRINHKIAAGLLPLNTYYWDDYLAFIKNLAKLFKEDNVASDKNELLRYLVNEVKIQCTSSQYQKVIFGILQIFEDLQFSNSAEYNSFKLYCEQLKKVIDYKIEKDEAETSKQYKSEFKTANKKKLKGLNVTDSKSIEAFF